MKTQIAIAFFLLIGVASAGLVGGWSSQSTELTTEMMLLINFGLKTISQTNHGFNAMQYKPVKLLDVQTQVVAGINTKMLVEIDDGKSALGSKKLLQVVIYSGFDRTNKLTDWSVLDSDAKFEALNDEGVLLELKRGITNRLAYEDAMNDKPVAVYSIGKVLSTFQTKRYGKAIYYIKATVEGTDNSIRMHEFWFADDGNDPFAHVKLPMRRETLENHPNLTLAGKSGVKCENLNSYFFCEISQGCKNNMLGAGKCE